jgi:hypothetical protein
VEDAERVQLPARLTLGTQARIDFFEEMIELARPSGALAPQRLALRDVPSRQACGASGDGSCERA